MSSLISNSAVLGAPLPTLMVIPSGIGCSIGGFAGDAIPSARLLAAASGCLITHPNVMNGATLYWSDSRIQYVEGYSLDRFAAGEIALRPVRDQQVGLLLDAGIERELRQRHLQVLDGCQASLGLNVGPVITTEFPLDVRLQNGKSGASWGCLGEPDVLLRAGEKLKESGATAIAVVTRFPDDFGSEALSAYRRGEGVDSLAGAEAVISHLLVKHLLIPCAHAPAIAPLPIDAHLDPRAAGEELGYTFLPSVLVGLSRAPDLVPVSTNDENKKIELQRSLYVDQLCAVVAPEGALGGEAVLACLERGIRLIVVSNPGVMGVSSLALGLHQKLKEKNTSRIISAKNYIEAAGLLMLFREGINFNSLARPLIGIDELE